MPRFLDALQTPVLDIAHIEMAQYYVRWRCSRLPGSWPPLADSDAPYDALLAHLTAQHDDEVLAGINARERDRIEREFLAEERTPAMPDPDQALREAIAITVRNDIARRLWEELAAADRAARRLHRPGHGYAALSGQLTHARAYRDALVDAYHTVTGDDLTAIAERLQDDWANSGTETNAWGDD